MADQVIHLEVTWFLGKLMDFKWLFQMITQMDILGVMLTEYMLQIEVMAMLKLVIQRWPKLFSGLIFFGFIAVSWGGNLFGFVLQPQLLLLIKGHSSSSFYLFNKDLIFLE